MNVARTNMLQFQNSSGGRILTISSVIEYFLLQKPRMLQDFAKRPKMFKSTIATVEK